MTPPLAGLRVVVTRAEHQAEGLVQRLCAEGAEVALLPLLALVPPADLRPLERAASELALYDWVVFSSANAVEAFMPLAGGAVPMSVSVAVVGPATARALRAFGIEPHVEARKSEAEGLVESLASHLKHGHRILLPQAADARPALAEGLKTVGAEVDCVVAYDKRLPPEAPAQAEVLFAGHVIGWVTFTSPRIVRHFAELFGTAWEERRTELEAASIGRITTAELLRQGVERIVEAATPGDAELVRAIVEACGAGR
jgi:uroporphyrinogen-III synthase